jgi:hypothetical protein
MNESERGGGDRTRSGKFLVAEKSSKKRRIKLFLIALLARILLSLQKKGLLEIVMPEVK